MAIEIIGHTPCPLCGFPHQEVRLTDGGKPYITCDECGMQLFARQPKAVRILKEKALSGQPVRAIDTSAGRVDKTAGSEQVSKKEAAETPKPEKTIFDFFGGGD